VDDAAWEDAGLFRGVVDGSRCEEIAALADMQGVRAMEYQALEQALKIKERRYLEKARAKAAQEGDLDLLERLSQKIRSLK